MGQRVAPQHQSLKVCASAAVGQVSTLDRRPEVEAQAVEVAAKVRSIWIARVQLSALCQPYENDGSYGRRSEARQMARGL